MIKKKVLDKAIVCCTLGSIGEVENDCKKFYGYQPCTIQNYNQLIDWIDSTKYPLALIRYEWLKHICDDTVEAPIYKLMSKKKIGVAFDEAQRIKNSGKGDFNLASQTFYFAYKLTRAATSIVPITATPIYSGLDDFWSLMFCTDKKILGSYDEFISQYYVMEWAPLAFYNTSNYFCKICGRPMTYKNLDGKGYMVCTHPQGCLVITNPNGTQRRKSYMWRIKHEQRVVSYKNISQLANRVVNNIFCYFPEQDIRFHEVSVKMCAESWDKYMAIVNDTIKYKLTPDQADKQKDPTPWSTRQLWLQYAIDNSPEKLYGLMSTIKQNLHKGVIVYCYYHESIDSVVNELKFYQYQYRVYSGKQSKKERDAIKEWFVSDPVNKVLIISQAGGASLNLQVTDTFIFYSSPTTFGSFSQAFGRIVRMYSKFKTFHIYFINVYDTIDVYKAAWFISHKNIMHDLFNNKIIPENVPELELSSALRKYLRDKYVWHKQYTQTLSGGQALSQDVAQ